MTETNSHEELVGKTLEKMSDRCNVVSPALKLLSYILKVGGGYQSPQCRNLHCLLIFPSSC